MKTHNVQHMVMTAALLALTAVFQYLRFLPVDVNISVYLIGTLVNLCLILAAGLIGLWSGLAISVAAPLVALAQGYAKLPLLPYLIIGNAVLVIIYSLWAIPGFRKSGRMRFGPWAVSGVLAAVVKFLIIAAGMALMLSSQKGAPYLTMLTAGAIQQIQQLVTAVLAMVVSYLVLPKVKKAARL